MKRKIYISLALLFFLLTLTACSYNANQAANNNETNPQQPGAGRIRRPDFGQPERAVDIRGVVKSVLGNDVTLIKIDLPDRQASSTPDNASQTDNSSSSPRGTALSLGGSGANIPGSGAGRAGAFMGRPGGGPDNGTNTREQMLARLKEMSTGEENIVIPVGIKMMKADNTNGKREMVEATLADIAADKMIMVWLNPSVTDKKVAEFVLIN